MAEGEARLGVHHQGIVQSANRYLNARKVLLTSLGALALTLEESNHFIERLVARGTVAEVDVQKLLNDYCGEAQAKGLELGSAAKELEIGEMEVLSQKISKLGKFRLSSDSANFKDKTYYFLNSVPGQGRRILF